VLLLLFFEIFLLLSLLLLLLLYSLLLLLLLILLCWFEIFALMVFSPVLCADSWCVRVACPMEASRLLSKRRGNASGGGKACALKAEAWWWCPVVGWVV